jgi:hypothetical protein
MKRNEIVIAQYSAYNNSIHDVKIAGWMARISAITNVLRALCINSVIMFYNSLFSLIQYYEAKSC